MYNGKVTGKTHVCRDTTQIKYVASPVTARGYPPCADLGGARTHNDPDERAYGFTPGVGSVENGYPEGCLDQTQRPIASVRRDA